MDRRKLDLSRTIAHALRHEPRLYGLELDSEGWVQLKVLLSALRSQRSEWCQLTSRDILRVIDTPEKQRFELRSGRIRALYGHSTPERMLRAPAKPPTVLYHGTSPETAKLIVNQGLKPMGRQFVHLSVDRKTAMTVGRRKSSEPVVFVVAAAEAHASGIVFYAANEQVWLAESIPPEYLRYG